MDITRRLLVVLFAALLGVALIAVPAAGGSAENAEKGRNRGYTPTEGNSADPKSSNGQGSPKNQSNPDGGGVDKPVPATQGTSDWDWNNGCGNDDDRDDDNNGWCGRKPEQSQDQSSQGRAKVKGAGGESEDEGGAAVRDGRFDAIGNPESEVLGASGESPAAAQVLGATFTRGGAEVLGASGDRTAVLGAGFDTLPVTGIPALIAGLLGLVMTVAGSLILNRGTKK